MSAVGVGVESSTKNTGGDQTDEAASGSAPAAIVKWIPGEAITFYAALIGIGATQGQITGNETPEELLERIDAGSPGWFIAGAVIAVLLVITGAIAGKTAEATFSQKSLFVRAMLVLASFVIWATALPGSWAYSWTWIRDMGPAYALILVPVALIFSGIAEYLTKKLKL
jgi:hypothetical protein